MQPGARRVWTLVATLSVLATLGVVSCGGGAAPRRELASNNPLDRARAIVRVAEARDARALPKLVDLLDDSDAGVRMFAIVALRRLTGEDFGFRYYDSEPARAAAIQRWHEALRSGQVQFHVPPAGETPPQTAGTGATGDAVAGADET